MHLFLYSIATEVLPIFLSQRTIDRWSNFLGIQYVYITPRGRMGVPVHVVSGRGNVHHLHGAAGQAEGEGPQGALPSPVHQVIHPIL